MQWRPGLILSKPSVDNIHLIPGRELWIFFLIVFVYAAPGSTRPSSSKTHFDLHFWEEKSVTFLKTALLLLQCTYTFGYVINAFSNGFLSQRHRKLDLWKMPPSPATALTFRSSRMLFMDSVYLCFYKIVFAVFLEPRLFISNHTFIIFQRLLY